jgi:hypothetical protein
MFKKIFLIIIIIGFSTIIVKSQESIKTSDLFKKSDTDSHAGHLNIIQDPALDTLMNRYILQYKNLEDQNEHAGMAGYRIQIYYGDNRDQSSKIQADFMTKFKDIRSYQQFAVPRYWKIKVGDFRTQTEATKEYLLINKAFPEAYIVPDFINFPDLNTK